MESKHTHSPSKKLPPLAASSKDAFFRDLEKYGFLTYAEEIELAKRRDAGDKTAIDELVLRNMKYVRYIAGRFQGKGLETEDLIQHGYFGLRIAAERFDHTRGCRFITYAHDWVRHCLQRAVADEGKTVRVPVHRHETRAKIYKAIGKLSALGNENPTPEEISEEAGLPVKGVRGTLETANMRKLSLDAKIGDDPENATFIELRPDTNNVPADESILRDKFREMIHEVLLELTPREREILERRFGFNGYEPHSLKNIGNRVGLTKERIRQVEAKALSTLKTKLGERLDKETMKSGEDGDLWGV